ncbi:hypothetical protein JXA47_00620 [Candidatus Sumerlaeota bacterium]|nr:hypothetical protein [Candidatus Sumerlaeota bacterium]
MSTAGQVHIDAALTNVSVAYRNPHHIADLIAPIVGVRKQSDKYFTVDADRERFRSSDDTRAPGAEANEVDFAISSESYFCEDHALEAVITDEERDNADPAIQPDIDKTEFLTDKILLNKEIALADEIAMNGSLPSETLSGADQWDDYDDSDPVAEVEEHKSTIQTAVQQIPNTLVLPYEVYRIVRLHPKVLEKVVNVRLGAVGPDILADVFDVDRVLVPRGLKNTAAPGQAPALEPIWGKSAFLCYVSPRPGLRTATFAYTFQWSIAPGSLQGHVVEAWREERRKADMVRVQRYYDQRIIASGAVYIWKSAVG